MSKIIDSYIQGLESPLKEKVSAVCGLSTKIRNFVHHLIIGHALSAKQLEVIFSIERVTRKSPVEIIALLVKNAIKEDLEQETCRAWVSFREGGGGDILIEVRRKLNIEEGNLIDNNTN